MQAVLEDSGIIELFFRRDEAAVASCREKYGAMLRRIAYGILCSREDSEECENDTYLRTWNHIPPEKPASLGAYLGRIVRNLALNYVERKNASKRCGNTLLFSELEQMLPGNGKETGNSLWEAAAAKDSIADRIDEKVLTELIEKWLRGLEKEERILFVRRYWYGDDIKELARRYMTTPGKLSSRLFRLRERLRGYLEKEGVHV